MAKILDSASDLFGKSLNLAGDIFDKGKEAAGDIADSAGDAVSKGKVKAKIYDAGLEYDKLMRQLGAALYDQLKDDPTYADANKSLFDQIAEVVERKQKLADELAEIEAAAQASKPIDVEPVPPTEEPSAEEPVAEEPVAEDAAADAADTTQEETAE